LQELDVSIVCSSSLDYTLSIAQLNLAERGIRATEWFCSISFYDESWQNHKRT